jgi:hypothetical protein
MKALVILMVSTTAHKLTEVNFFKNVIDTLGADLALCTRDDEERTDNMFYERATYDWPVAHPTNWSDAYDEIKMAENSQEDWREASKIGKVWLGGLDTIENQSRTGAIVYYYRWKVLKKIRELGLVDKYDWFIISRHDYMWLVPHAPLNRFDKNSVWIPNAERYRGYTDRHQLIPTNFVECLNMVNPIIHHPRELYKMLLGMAGEDDINPEMYVNVYFKGILGLNVNEFPYVMYLVRESDGPASWSMGHYSKALGYNIKYINEYLHASYYISKYQLFGDEFWSQEEF